MKGTTIIVEFNVCYMPIFKNTQYYNIYYKIYITK